MFSTQRFSSTVGPPHDHHAGRCHLFTIHTAQHPPFFFFCRGWGRKKQAMSRHSSVQYDKEGASRFLCRPQRHTAPTRMDYCILPAKSRARGQRPRTHKHIYTGSRSAGPRQWVESRGPATSVRHVIVSTLKFGVGQLETRVLFSPVSRIFWP